MYKNRPKQGMKSIEKLYNLKCVITDIYDVYLCIYWLLTLFNRSIKSTVMEIVLIEFFVHIMWVKCEKMPVFSLVAFI